jgi:TPR repeat protein
MRKTIGGIRVVLLALIGCSIALGAHAQEGDRRVALVIGNAGYQHVERLANPGNDAKLIADILRKSGFVLIGGGPQSDLDKPAFDRLVADFGKKIQGADVALFYYAGHGMQVQGTNWLVPTDANPTRAQDLDFQMVNAELVLKQMDGAGTRLNIVILDACRNNPFANLGTRAVESGLAQMKAPDGTLISFATQPGNVAVDGKGADGPYAMALATAIRQPGLDIFHLFNQVGLSVKRDTQGSQQPWVSSSPIDGEFFFVRSEATTDDAVVPALDVAGGAQDGAKRGASASSAGSNAATAAKVKEPPATEPPQATRDAAEKGQAVAQIDLGLNFAKGTGAPKDLAAALQWFQRAADQNDPRGQYYVGLMHERGYAVERSYATALSWYQKAAEQNYPPAEIAVARFHGQGLGVPRDLTQRNAWLARAAGQDSPLAENVLGNIYRLGLGVPQDLAAAAQWYQRAAGHDFAPAQARLGLMYMHGNGVKKDYVQAMQYLRHAADKGNPLAQNGIGVLYEHGYGVRQDYVEAARWFRLAADKGYGQAALNLGVMYADGRGVPRDRTEAAKWYEKAAAAGNEMAVARLARIEPAVTPH